MTWVKLDDLYPTHPKVVSLSDSAFRLNTEAFCYCSRYLTNGVIHRREFAQVSVRAKPRYAAELVSRGLWHEAGQTCDSEDCAAPTDDGWVIHDYLAYQPHKADVLRQREAAKARQRKHRERDPETGQFQPSRRDRGVTVNGSHTVTSGVTSDLVTPLPSRPKPKPDPITSSSPWVTNGPLGAISEDEATRVIEKIEKRHHPVNMDAYIAAIPDENLMRLLDEVREDIRRNEVGNFLHDSRTAPPCPHGQPGGDRLRPDTSKPQCPLCRNAREGTK